MTPNNIWASTSCYLQARIRRDISELLINTLRDRGLSTTRAAPEIMIEEPVLYSITKCERDLTLEEIIRISLWANKAPVLEFRDELTVSFP